jgi:hypothetical protein
MVPVTIEIAKAGRGDKKLKARIGTIIAAAIFATLKTVATRCLFSSMQSKSL